MRRYIILVIIAMLFIVSCENEKIVYRNIEDPEKVTVSGTVYAVKCPNSFSGDGVASRRYTVETGVEAKLMFEKPNFYGKITWTDDSSDFTVELDTGVYRVIYECGHMFPDTFYNIPIYNDTVIDANLVYAYERYDSVRFVFRYDIPSDSLGDSIEYNMLQSLNEEMEYSFDLENAEVDRYLSTSYAVVYNTKIDPKYFTWQVMLWADYIIARRGSSYRYISVDPYGFFCFG